jgi:hypothetical protein
MEKETSGVEAFSDEVFAIALTLLILLRTQLSETIPVVHGILYFREFQCISIQNVW